MEYQKYQQALEDFAKLPENERKDSEVLTEALEGIARTGSYYYDWAQLQQYLKFKIDTIVNPGQFEGKDQFTDGDTYEQARQRVHNLLINFPEAPFTLQRICELVMDPKKHYTQLRKAMGSLEKLLTVSSTQPREDVMAVESNSNETVSPMEEEIFDITVDQSAEQHHHHQQQEQQQQPLAEQHQQQQERAAQPQQPSAQESHRPEEQQQQQEHQPPVQESKDEAMEIETSATSEQQATK